MRLGKRGLDERVHLGTVTKPRQNERVPLTRHVVDSKDARMLGDRSLYRYDVTLGDAHLHYCSERESGLLGIDIGQETTQNACFLKAAQSIADGSERDSCSGC
jgi:hypothetical protein